MHKLSSIAAASLLLASAHAAPNAVQPRATDIALKPWVTVNEDGKPSTVTPVMSTISGTPTLISGAPHDLTASVFTYTSYGKVITSTGPPPQPTANGKGATSVWVCHNLDGENAPWCLPTGKEPMYKDTEYPFTWDAEFFKAPNATLFVVGNWLNSTTNEPITDEVAFSSPEIQASLGAWSLRIEDKLLRHQNSKNITIALVSSEHGKGPYKGPDITVTNRPGPAPNGRGKTPHGAALYIALPTVLGFVVLCLVGTCLWNRHHRHIQLGKVMGRNYDVGKTSRSRFGLGKKKNKNKMDPNQRIHLMEREIEAEGGEVYHDLPDPANRPRRDSDALGSLAGTPTEDRRMDFGATTTTTTDGRPAPAPATGNAFRDELRRQADERP
ncbi:hypothetical protein GGS20DRAFT_534253 [Poronia punctata]|nr:hypothetical protein GGS20DRAFT_534253 [Poronia punctata]